MGAARSPPFDQRRQACCRDPDFHRPCETGSVRVHVVASLAAWNVVVGAFHVHAGLRRPASDPSALGEVVRVVAYAQACGSCRQLGFHRF
jgi:hypothetical protein